MPDEKDIESLKAKAASGDAAAQGRLGKEYLTGSARCAKDEAEAVRWLAPAAAGGDPLGCWGMASCLLLGLGGVPRDPAAAMPLCEKSIAAGCADGFRLRGFQYAKGIGVTKDQQEACRWYKMAADMGDADAQVNLGFMYADGSGVPQSHAEAFRLFRAAAESGNAKALRVLGDMFWEGTGIGKDETAAVRLYLLAAAQGDSMAQCRLGFAYEEGKGAEKDPVRARFWYKSAAEKGLALAQFILGEFCAEGKGGTQDFEEAARWYEAAAYQGHADAQTRLGLMCFRGQGMSRDEGKARQWLKMAVEQGDEDGARYLKELDDIQAAGDKMPVLGLRPAAGLLIRTAMEVNREAYMAFLKLAAEYGHACVLPEGGGETAWCTGLLAIQAKLAYAACFARDAGLLDNEIRALLGGTGGKEAGLFDPGSFTAHLRLWDAMEKMLRGSPEGRGDPASLMLMRIVYQQVYGEAEFSADRLGDINSLFCRVWDAVRPYFLIWDWIRNDFELDFSGSGAPFDSLWPGVILTMKFDPADWKPTLDHGAVFRVVSAEDLERTVNEREEGIPWR